MPSWEIPLGSGPLGLPDLALGALACCSRWGWGGVGKDGVSWPPRSASWCQGRRVLPGWARRWPARPPWLSLQHPQLWLWLGPLTGWACLRAAWRRGRDRWSLLLLPVPPPAPGLCANGLLLSQAHPWAGKRSRVLRLAGFAGLISQWLLDSCLGA